MVWRLDPLVLVELVPFFHIPRDPSKRSSYSCRSLISWFCSALSQCEQFSTILCRSADVYMFSILWILFASVVSIQSPLSTSGDCMWNLALLPCDLCCVIFAVSNNKLMHSNAWYFHRWLCHNYMMLHWIHPYMYCIQSFDFHGMSVVCFLLDTYFWL